MSETQVFNHGDAPAIALGAEHLDALGVRVGDSVEVSVVNGQLVVRPIDEQSRKKMISAAIEDVMQRRRSVFEELAKGGK